VKVRISDGQASLWYIWDIICRKEATTVAAYNVSGEYSMLLPPLTAGLTKSGGWKLDRFQTRWR